MRRRRLGHFAFFFALVTGLLALPATAWATVTPPGLCQGTATIQGETYNQDSTTIELDVDEDNVMIPWSGTFNAENKNYSGAINLEIGPFEIEIADWGPDPNENDIPSNSGVYDLDELWDDLPFRPLGTYDVSGFHQASGGRCDGSFEVELTGNFWTNPLGAASAIGTAVFGILTAVAGIPRSRVRKTR